MAKPNRSDRQPTRARYEFRVWGRHRKARKLLAQLADDQITETIEDCYFLGDEAGVNVKVRDRILKVKQLVEREDGFERWESNRYRAADTAPAPFCELFEQLHRLHEQHGKAFDLAKAVARLDKSAEGRAVLVTKERRRFRIGSMRAEITDVTLDHTGNVLRTLAIEGDDLDELVQLRKTARAQGIDERGVARRHRSRPLTRAQSSVSSTSSRWCTGSAEVRTTPARLATMRRRNR